MTSVKVQDSIDWSIYQGLVPDKIYCNCGEIFWSYTQYIYNGATTIKYRKRIYSQKPCPSCFKTDNASEIITATYKVDRVANNIGI